MRWMYDAVVIGGGFYGAAIALYLSGRRGMSNVVLLEREPALLARASYHNQARVHNGYHYPRSFTTAFRSRINLPHFVHDYESAVKRDFVKLYAIASRNSKVTAKQFTRFCHEIGAKLEPAPPSLHAMFEPRLIEDVFLVEEYAFDASVLGRRAEDDLARAGVEVRLGTQAQRIGTADGGIKVECEGGGATAVAGRYVFNCTYSGLNQLAGDFPGTTMRLKHEIAEMALMRVPFPLEGLGVTVMDGPFFSMMPFPARRLHTLSHVRYTPHQHWADQAGVDPYRKLERYERETRVERMVRDVARYLPAMADAEYVDSLFEVKTILVKNESDDGRPILFERHPEVPRCYSILGGKIDNIYDVLIKLEGESFE